jgi:hypothetical protein
MKFNNVLSSNDLWPDQMDKKIYSGFSDEEIESVCDWGLRGYDKTLPYKSCRWLYWTVELYSLGRCYRDWLELPAWAPLPLYGDHGVTYSGSLETHEEEAKPKHHLTWFKDRSENIPKYSRKKVIRIPHPWITYRKKYGIKKKENACGTIIFYAHSVKNIEIIDYNWDKYFEYLQGLPKEYHPLVICMHRHDIEKGYHLNIRKYNIPIISAGETSSPYFVDRFYDIISRMRFATSNVGGSELFYCEELGVEYFIYGDKPTYFNFAHPESPLGVGKPLNTVDEIAQVKQRKLFSQFPPKPNAEKQNFVMTVLGLDVNSDAAKKMLRTALIKEYMRHLPQIFINFIALVTFMLIPNPLKVFLRRVRKSFKKST